MRRPIIFLFLSFIFGIALEFHRNLKPIQFVFFMVVLGAVFCGSRFLKKKESVQFACLFLSVSLLGSIYFYLVDKHNDPLEFSEGKICTVEGRIITVQSKGEKSWQMLITAGSIGKRLVSVRGTMDDPVKYIGKWASVSGEISLPSERRNPGLFDYRLYLKTKGVRVILLSNAEKVALSDGGSTILFNGIARLKYGFLDQLETAMSPDAFGLMTGMLFGDSSFISDDVYEAFQKNGVAHILSVSGIHVGIVYLYLGRLLRNRKTKSFYILSALFLIFYAALSEFSPSVLRAVVMIFIHMFAKISHRRYDFLSCTCASALGMLMVNPFYLFNAGFQLSYLAVFCLAAMMPFVNRRITILEGQGVNELITEGMRAAAPLLIIQLGMAPLTAYLFNYFSVVSFFINTPIIAISGIIIPLGMVLIPVSFCASMLFGVGAQAAELLIDLMMWLNKLFYLPGVGFFNMVSPMIYVLLIFYGFFFFLSSEFFRVLYQRKRKKVISVYCCLILIFSAAFSGAAAENGFRSPGLVFVDVGQGDCLHIRTPGGKNILIDGGGSVDYDVGKKILLPYLLKNGVKTVDLAIATHLHTDHYLGISQLAQNMTVKRFGTYAANIYREQEILKDTGLKKKNLLYLAGGDRIKIEKDIWIDVLYPEKKSSDDYRSLIQNEEDENRSSLFMKVSYKGMTVLMTGDIGTEGEQEIMKLYKNNPSMLDVDILKVGHHGSRYSTSDGFLDAVSPEVAVFQVGKNNFGHPHPTVIEKCRKKGIIICRNDLNGAIILKEEGQTWHIKVLLRRSMHIKESIKTLKATA